MGIPSNPHLDSPFIPYLFHGICNVRTNLAPNRPKAKCIAEKTHYSCDKKFSNDFEHEGFRTLGSVSIQQQPSFALGYMFFPSVICLLLRAKQLDIVGLIQDIFFN